MSACIMNLFHVQRVAVLVMIIIIIIIRYLNQSEQRHLRKRHVKNEYKSLRSTLTVCELKKYYSKLKYNTRFLK